MGVYNPDIDSKAVRLIAIANELLAVAKVMEREDTSGNPQASQGTGSTNPVDGDHPLWVELAREHYQSRRRRDKIFGSEGLFGEPGWDILLDLFIAAKEGRRISVMSACIGAAVPSTTALRWISALEREGLLLRQDDPNDARRTYVDLSPRGYMAMVEYFIGTAKTIRTTSLARLTEFDGVEHEANTAAVHPGTTDAGDTEYFPARRKLHG